MTPEPILREIEEAHVLLVLAGHTLQDGQVEAARGLAREAIDKLREVEARIAALGQHVDVDKIVGTREEAVARHNARRRS